VSWEKELKLGKLRKLGRAGSSACLGAPLFKALMRQPPFLHKTIWRNKLPRESSKSCKTSTLPTRMVFNKSVSRVLAANSLSQPPSGSFWGIVLGVMFENVVWRFLWLFLAISTRSILIWCFIPASKLGDIEAEVRITLFLDPLHLLPRKY
jgi:hypothetical protein